MEDKTQTNNMPAQTDFELAIQYSSDLQSTRFPTFQNVRNFRNWKAFRSGIACDL